MPGAVVEPLYITDPFEGSIADSSAGQETIADASRRRSSGSSAPADSEQLCMFGKISVELLD